MLWQGRREKEGREGASPPPFPGATYLHVNNKWDLSLFIEQDISDKK